MDVTSKNLHGVNIEDEMKRSYLEYAMSVIVGRALPDVRDGLKPVHRRCLYAMHDMGNDFNKPYKKSARVVGDVIGKYHPHGDTAVYDTIVRMAQPFSLRYPLVDGQGNFGSVDGDAPAAMRYTEVRLTRLAHELLADLDKETVGFRPNYDDSLSEPDVLPARLPNLLVNGSEGIAVGMATKIPPHNIREVVQAALCLLDNERATVEELMAHLPGPDFPTGGFICGSEGIEKAYRTGRGIVQMRGRVRVEKMKRGPALVVTEIPYQVNKAALVEKIADLVKEKKLEGIADLRDESDREGMRVVIELKKDENPQRVLAALYRQTQLQLSFGIIMLAVVHGRPKLLTLPEVLGHFLEHRRQVVTRRTEFELNKALARAHILEGLLVAIANLDEVVALIRAAASPDAAKRGLMAQFGLSELQAQAILDLRLQRLTALERDKLTADYEELTRLIARLRAILASEEGIRSVIRAELTSLTEAYGDVRRTEILDATAPTSGAVTVAEIEVGEETAVISYSLAGYLKRSPESDYRIQRRAGRPEGEEPLAAQYRCAPDATLALVTGQGKLHWLKVADIPEGGRGARGRAIANLVSLAAGEEPLALLDPQEFAAGRFLVTLTARGNLKRTELTGFGNPRVGGIIAVSLEEGDALVAALVTDGNRELLLGTAQGKCLRCRENDARPMGRAVVGVRGIALEGDDRLVSALALPDQTAGLALGVATSLGFGKLTPLAEYPVQGRGGKGVIATKVGPKNGLVTALFLAGAGAELVVATADGTVQHLPATVFPAMGRNTLGDKIKEAPAGLVYVGPAPDHNPADSAD